MKNKISPLVAAVGFAAMLPSVASAAVIYTDSAVFAANVASSYAENFSGLPAGDQGLGAVSFSGNGFAYNIDAPNGLYRTTANGTWLQTFSSAETMTVAFTSGNVTAVGGTFIQSDAGENPLAGTFHVILSDGTDQSVTSLGSGTQPFTGFTTTSPTFITSMTVSSPGAGSFATLENLTVGAAVPEPQHYAMAAGLGLLAFGAFRRVRSGKLA